MGASRDRQGGKKGVEWWLIVQYYYWTQLDRQAKIEAHEPNYANSDPFRSAEGF